MKIMIALFTGLLLTGTALAQESLQNVNYDNNGRYAVQVEAWRSEEKAHKRTAFWKEQGFEHVRFVKHGDEATGDVWFRVHLGRFTNMRNAGNFQVVFASLYDDETWITTTNGKSEPLL